MDFTTKTYEELLQEKLDRIPEKYDKRESSMIYNALAPNSVETSAMYLFMEWALDNVFGDTAEREYLERIALFTKGLIPAKATKAVCLLETDAPIETGSRFTADTASFVVIEEMESSNSYHQYKTECTEAGVEGNNHTGTAIPVEYIQGLTYCQLTKILIPGEDEEDTNVS